MNILSIQTSATPFESSLTRRGSQILLDTIAKEAKVTELDLNQKRPEFVDFTINDNYIEQLKESDIVVIGSPMYNLSIPASLKVWIDRVVLAGVTFTYENGQPKGLLTDKKVYIVIASGTPMNDLDAYGLNFATPYLKAILAFIGITDVSFFYLNGRNEEQQSESLDKFKEAIHEL